jgi:hypothetical protein
VRLTIAAVLLVLSSVLTVANDTRSFTLAVLRRDGVLIPFASHRNGKWAASWPVPGRVSLVPITVEDVPEEWWGRTPTTLTWTLWPVDGAPRPLRANSPIRYSAQCLPGFGFTTDYKSSRPLPPPMERPFPKEGIAVSGGVTIERIDVLDKRAPEWDDFGRRIRKPFAEVERRAARSYSSWRHPTPRDQRETQPVTIEALYRAKVPDAGEIYYLEASRAYDDPRQKDGCDVVTFASGWVRPWKPEKDVFDLSAVVTYCDRAAAEFVLPLGSIRLAGRPPAWILQVASWDYERYVVMETGRDENRLLIDAFGGNCPKPRGR